MAIKRNEKDNKAKGEFVQSTSPTLDAIVADIKQAAATLGLDPSQVTKSKYYAGGGRFTEHQLKSKGGITGIISDAFPFTPSSTDLIAIRGTQTRTLALRKLQREYGTAAYREERFKSVLSEAFKQQPIVLSVAKKEPKRRTAKKIERYNIGHLSDIHFGIGIDPLEIEENQYNWLISARRLAQVIESLAHYKLDHREECGGLVLNMGGDLAQGIIHSDDANQDLLTWQFAGAVRYICSAVDYLLNFYDKILIPVTPDNHMRILTHSKGHDRARAQKYDSFNSMMFEAIQQAFRRDSRVEFIIPRTPYTTYKVFDRTFLSTHGDTVLNLGSPEKAVDIGNISRQIDRLNSSASESDRVQVVLAGHVHTALYLGLPNDVDLFINPSLSGTDAYAQSLGFLKSRTGQWIFESTREHRIGDTRLIWTNDADNNKTLDEIIPTFDYNLMLKKNGL